jgi:hemoglobin
MSTFEQRTALRAQIAPGTAVGVTEALIEQVVHTFYGRVRRDPEIGPIFEAAIGHGWDDHLAKLCDFWSSVLLMTGRFKGAPMAAHVRLPDLGPAHFERWLSLWRQTAQELAPAEAAALFIEKAATIAQSLQLGIAASRGELPPLRG